MKKDNIQAGNSLKKMCFLHLVDQSSYIRKQINDVVSLLLLEMDSFRILLYSLIFLLSVFGNLLIIVVLMLNKRMRTVTNSFLLSLAVSDLMMAIFCMPFTLIPNILEDFIFGAAMCKTVSYFMGEDGLFYFKPGSVFWEICLFTSLSKLIKPCVN